MPTEYELKKATETVHGKYRLIVYDYPRDFFEDCTVPVSSWLGRGYTPQELYIQNLPENFFPNYNLGKYIEYGEVLNIVLAASEGKLRHEPAIGYDHTRDTHYFIFKFDNNGTSFVIEKI